MLDEFTVIDRHKAGAFFRCMSAESAWKNLRNKVGESRDGFFSFVPVAVDSAK
jgi:hypothetical protein